MFIHTLAQKSPPQLSVVATSNDGQVEVVEAKDKTFYIGIKYHPELLVDIDKKQNNIFRKIEKIRKILWDMLN